LVHLHFYCETSSSSSESSSSHLRLSYSSASGTASASDPLTALSFVRARFVFISSLIRVVIVFQGVRVASSTRIRPLLILFRSLGSAGSGTDLGCARLWNGCRCQPIGCVTNGRGLACRPRIESFSAAAAAYALVGSVDPPWLADSQSRARSASRRLVTVYWPTRHPRPLTMSRRAALP